MAMPLVPIAVNETDYFSGIYLDKVSVEKYLRRNCLSTYNQQLLLKYFLNLFSILNLFSKVSKI